jgi:hypothetical protein
MRLLAKVEDHSDKKISKLADFLRCCCGTTEMVRFRTFVTNIYMLVR